MATTVTDKPGTSAGYVVNYTAYLGTSVVYLTAIGASENYQWLGNFSTPVSTSITWAKQPTRSEMDALNTKAENLGRTKILSISSGANNTVRISGITYGATTEIPCYIGRQFGILEVQRSGSVVNDPVFFGADKPTNTITKTQDADGTFHFDITVTQWTPCLFIWPRATDTIDQNVSISALTV